MMVRRLLTGVLLAGLAAPALAAAPHPAPPTAPRETIPAPPPGSVVRVFARSDGGEPDPGSPSASPAPLATLSPEIAARARAEFEANRSGRIDRTHYTADMNAVITDKALAQAAAHFESLGAVKAFTQVRRITKGSVTVYVFRIECEKPPLIEQAIAWTADGKVDYLQFLPAR